MRDKTWLRTAFLSLALITTATSDPIVKINATEVTFRGVTRGEVEDFHNIKFAHDTSGSRRFAPPEPYQAPQGSQIDASSPGPACPQLQASIPPFFADTPNQSEDCLHLRVTRPAGTTSSDNLPVVVHLVGGGVVKGSTDDEHFDPKNLITNSMSLRKPIIHVVVNYRLNIYGFARLPILQSDKSLNVGMRDQRAGIQWVKDNIASFGGDPSRITSFGLSSGGTFSSLHLMSYGGDRGVPFTQIWAMSGPPGTALNMTSDATEIHTRAVAKELGCGDEDDEAILKCLRGIPMDRLTESAMAYSINNHPPAGLFTFIPSIDEDFIPERQSVLYKSGRFVKGIPIVYGWAQDDGATNAGLAPIFKSEESMKIPIKNFAHALTDTDYEWLFSLYSVSDFEPDVRNYEARKRQSDPIAPVHFFRVARIMRDLLFTCSSIDFGFEVWRQSKKQDPGFSGVWHYVLNQSMVTPLFHAAGMPYLGVVHGSDLDYIYNNMFPRDQISDIDRQLSDTIIGSFINFAYTGNPGGAGSEPWPVSFREPEGLDGYPSESANPSDFNLQVLGGSLGTGSCHLTIGVGGNSLEEGEMQIPLGSTLEVGEMDSAEGERRTQLVQRERLLERCAFVNGLAERLGN